MYMKMVFITGGTGYIGSRLIARLLSEGYHVKALVRKGSEKKLPDKCEIIIGDALNSETYAHLVAPAKIFIHLVGVSHPSPAKVEAFRKIDWVSLVQAVNAAKKSTIEHFIYLSVAQYPSRIMQPYQNIRGEGEKLLQNNHFCSSFIRPWYVIGPNHWWPLLLKPLYWLAKMIPATKEGATQLDTVTLNQIISVLMYAVKNTPEDIAIYNVREIKKFN